MQGVTVVTEPWFAGINVMSSEYSSEEGEGEDADDNDCASFFKKIQICCRFHIIDALCVFSFTVKTIGCKRSRLEIEISSEHHVSHN